MNYLKKAASIFTVILTLIQCEGAQLTLSWVDNSDNEKGFEIERAQGVNATSGFATIAVVGPNVVTYLDANLADATAYTYRLRAYNDAGVSPYSNTASGMTLPAKPNGTPNLLPIESAPKYEPPLVTLTLSPGEGVYVVASP